MANYPGGAYSTLYVKSGKFGYKGTNSLEKMISNIDKYKKTINDAVDKAAANDAQYIAETLGKKYQEYVGSYGPGGALLDTGSINNYERSWFSLRKANKQWYNAPTLYITKIRGGYSVSLRGKDVLYQEFGTGKIGKNDHYPFAAMAKYGISIDWDYLVGTKILQGGNYLNAASNDIPYWYRSLLKNKKISKSDAVWMSPGGVTKGNHAGMFMFDTFQEYMDKVNNVSFTTGNVKLGKRSMYIMTRDILLTGKWK